LAKYSASIRFTMLEIIKNKSEGYFDETVDLRRTIHANPELAFDEFETAALVKSQLEPLGIHLETEVAKTGIVASIKGGQPGPDLALRADMDALPIHELNDLDYKSTKDGKMHACGHDAHTASLLTTAKIIHEMKDDWPGTVRMIFQPSEEKLPGGAKIMIEEGALDDNEVAKSPSGIFGQHVTPTIPVGQIGVRAGKYMASADEIYITIKGEGGHAAAPHLIKADAVYVMAQVITAMQSIISRTRPPNVASVLTIGKVVADGATNVIPDVVTMEGTLRSLDEEWRFKAFDVIKSVVEKTAIAHGAEAEVKVVQGYPFLFNDEKLAAFVKKSSIEYVGEENTLDLDVWFAGEDFAYFSQQMPGCFYRLGTGNVDKGITYGLHHPRFQIDEDALRISPGFMAYLTHSFASE